MWSVRYEHVNTLGLFWSWARQAWREVAPAPPSAPSTPSSDNCKWVVTAIYVVVVPFVISSTVNRKKIFFTCFAVTESWPQHPIKTHIFYYVPSNTEEITFLCNCVRIWYMKNHIMGNKGLLWTFCGSTFTRFWNVWFAVVFCGHNPLFSSVFSTEQVAKGTKMMSRIEFTRKHKWFCCLFWFLNKQDVTLDLLVH